MNKRKSFNYDELVARPVLQLREIEFQSPDVVAYEGLHKGMILMADWGSEWDDSDSLDTDIKLNKIRTLNS